MIKNIKISKKKLIDFVLLLLISLTIVSLFSMNYLNGDNCNYAVEEIHQFDNRIFKGNMSTLGIEYSPRYYANSLMAFLIRVFKSNWFETSFSMIKINYILYALVATFSSIKFLKKNRLIGCFLISLFLMTSPLISISFGLNFAPDVFLGTAAPLTFLALICVLGKEKYWLMAWILAIVSTFLHIHEGFWCAFLLGVIWLAICFSDKKVNFKVLIYIFVYLLFLILIVTPSLVNSYPVDNNYFTEIYVYIRIPHHLLLSFIGKWTIIKATLLLLFIGIVLFIDLFKYRENKNERRTIFILVLLSVTYIFLYFLHYFSTEVYKIPFIITMYIPKSFRFFTFLGLINYVILGLRRIKKGKFLNGSIILIIPLIPNLSENKFNYYIVLTLFVLFFILEKYNLKLFAVKKIYRKEVIKLKNIINILLYIIIFLLILKNYPLMLKRFLLLYFGILAYEFLYTYINNPKVKNVILAILLILFSGNFYKSMKGKIFYRTKNAYHYISGLEYAQKATDLELYQLAIEFKNITNLNEGFLSDPYAPYSNYFQLFSERNCYILYKNVPSHKHLVIEWYEKFLKAKKMLKANEEELKELLKDINIKYILLSEDKFDIIKDSPYFDEIIKNNKYGIFKLKGEQ